MALAHWVHVIIRALLWVLCPHTQWGAAWALGSRQWILLVVGNGVGCTRRFSEMLAVLAINSLDPGMNSICEGA